MKQLLKEKDIIGKTIKSTGYGKNAFCIIFTDDTFCIIRGTGWDENDVEFSFNKISLNLDHYDSFDLRYLVSMGLITKEQAEEASRKKDIERLEREKEEEYQKYLLLKSKYEK